MSIIRTLLKYYWDINVDLLIFFNIFMEKISTVQAIRIPPPPFPLLSSPLIVMIPSLLVDEVWGLSQEVGVTHAWISHSRVCSYCKTAGRDTWMHLNGSYWSNYLTQRAKIVKWEINLNIWLKVSISEINAKGIKVQLNWDINKWSNMWIISLENWYLLLIFWMWSSVDRLTINRSYIKLFFELSNCGLIIWILIKTVSLFVNSNYCSQPLCSIVWWLKVNY